jgi:beta-barrel assembly-enhancing protease
MAQTITHPATGRRLTAVAVLAIAAALSAQTKIVAPKNKFTAEQDVQLGQQSAAEVSKQLPIISDPEIQGYLDRLGRRLVDAAPRELNHPAFKYSFTPVDVKEINAFALPGGPMFVNRGMIEAATTEGEMVGVMAHELSHVLLRHGTANVTRAQKWQWGALAGAVAGAVVGGDAGSLIADTSNFGVGTLLLKYSRDYEKQADLLGAQIMARAGYDPVALGRMFETIAKQGGRGGPQWLSSHPDPGNRTAYIQKEASTLRVASAAPDAAGFQQARARLAGMSPAPTGEEAARRAAAGAPAPSVGTLGQPVPAPAAQYRTLKGGQLFEVSAPQNWQPVSSNNSVRLVPQNAMGEVNGQSVFTHGVQIGISRMEAQDLAQANDTLLRALAPSNRQLQRRGESRNVRLDQRSAILTPLLAPLPTAAGAEHVTLVTTMLADGSLFYVVCVVPEQEAAAYNDAFSRVLQSIRLKDTR